MINDFGPDTPPSAEAIGNNYNTHSVSDDLKFSRAAEANEYSCFVRQAALRLFTVDPQGIPTSDAVRLAEELAKELRKEGYFHIYCPEDVDLLD